MNSNWWKWTPQRTHTALQTCQIPHIQLAAPAQATAAWKEKAANTKPLHAPVATQPLGRGCLLAKLHSKCRSKEQDWQWHHNPTQITQPRSSHPCTAKLTSLPAQEGTPTPPGLQPHFEFGPPTIWGIAANTPKTPNDGTTWWSEWHFLCQAEWPRAGRCHLQGITSSTHGKCSNKLQLDLPW